jgi:hypothetical protein
VLRSIVGLKPVTLAFVLVTLASGVGFLVCVLLTPWLFGFFVWAVPLPFVAAALMLIINRNIEDRNYTSGYFGLWAVVGLTLMPLSFIMIGWVFALEHDQQVGEICEPEMPEETCFTTAELVNRTNSAVLPSLSFILGWFVPSLIFVILGYSYRLF